MVFVCIERRLYITMTVTLLLPLLLLCGSQASHYHGTVMTFTPKFRMCQDDESVRVVFHYKLNFHSCTDEDSWKCVSGDCGTESVELYIVDQEAEIWCQREGVMFRQVSTNALFQLRLEGGDWMSGLKNGISGWRAVTKVDLRIRSDMGQPNSSPQTTILPILRVPSNCQRDYNLLAFDADGDEVKCRYGNTAAEECNPCTPPSVLTISPTCTLSFHSTSSSNEGPYAVQLEMEDFPRHTISLFQSDGVETRTPCDALSKIPIRFVLMVDTAVPCCTEGKYLPRFLPPTPAKGAQLIAYVNQPLEINIKAEATKSQVSQLFFSGPHGMVKQTGLEGQFLLNWTTSEKENGENHPICFVVQAVNNLNKYHSELRCVIVNVRNEPTTTMLPTTTTNTPTTPQKPTTTMLPTTTTNTPTAPQSTTIAPSIPENETEVQSNRTKELDESIYSHENSGVGKVFIIVFGVGIVGIIAGVAVWAVRRYKRQGRWSIDGMQQLQ
ncbi:uncharacterized protein LOC122974133 [Thunnus albacares]|uniref:uncharacterized protein LOC122974133 n=1 Tax=Thunnus albacares TaxID=8236 RepID=UPI001CF6E03B|nr:uncharacterized protein LOC122974133 [Thunnus albacares]